LVQPGHTRKSRRTFVPKGKLLRCLGEVSLLSSRPSIQIVTRDRAICAEICRRFR
jgi:hypothetical protein